MKFNKLVDLIGNTPLVEAQNLVPNKNVKLLLKVRSYGLTLACKSSIFQIFLLLYSYVCL